MVYGRIVRETKKKRDRLDEGRTDGSRKQETSKEEARQK